MKKPFSAILKEYRVDGGFTKLEMAAKLGISERMYAYYEKGDYDGSTQKVKKYMDKLASGKFQESENTGRQHSGTEGNNSAELYPKLIKLLEERVALESEKSRRLEEENRKLKEENQLLIAKLGKRPAN